MKTPDEREQDIDQWLKRNQRVVSAASDACLDAETAAAWADGGLSGRALEAARTHVSGCGRCQALMRTLLELDGVAAATLEGREDAGPSWWRGWLRWALPLAATAAAVVAVAVWTRAPTPTESVTTVAPTPTASNSASQARAAVETRSTIEEAREQPAAAPKAMNPPPPLERREAPPPNTRVDALAVPTPAPPAPLAPSEPPAARARSAEVLVGQNARAVSAAATPVFEVVSPDPSVRWRVAGGRIERSSDAGATWVPANTADQAIRAGSAPATSVCWLVGGAGVILRTTDGMRWTRVAFPEPVDLVGVDAASAAEARVIAADGRGFRTADGGSSWTVDR